MRNDVYAFLINFGFTREDSDYFQRENEEIYKLTLEKLIKNIAFLYSKDLTKEEIIFVFKKDPHMLLSADDILEELDKVYYGELMLSKDELYQLFINNPEIYTQSPVQQKYIIDYLKSKNYSKSVIKHWILANHKVLNMTYNEFKEYETTTAGLIDPVFVSRHLTYDNQMIAPVSFLTIGEISARLSNESAVEKIKKLRRFFDCDEKTKSSFIQIVDSLIALLIYNIDTEIDDFMIADGVLKGYIGSGGDVVIPQGVTEIDKAFRQCKTVTSVIIPDGVITIKDQAFHDCKGLKTVHLSDTVEYIGEFAFANCSQLTDINISKVEFIGEDAFMQCSSLKAITISDKMADIKKRTFLYCTSLKHIVIPDSIISIEDYAFAGCRNLKDVYISANTKNIGKNAFELYPGLTIHVIAE